MKRMIVWLIGVVIVGAPAAARPDDRSPAARDALAFLDRFEGEWTIDGRWTSGEELHARTVYAWGLGKTILKAQTFVRNGDSEYQRYEGVMAWHPKKNGLFQISFAYNGDVTETLMQVDGKNTLLIGWSPFGEGQPSNVRQTITLTAPDTFLWKVELKEEAGWKTLIEGTWKKKPHKPGT